MIAVLARAFSEDVVESPPSSIESADQAMRALGDLVRLVDPHTEAAPVAVLIQAITYFGNLIGRGPHQASKYGLGA
jgi:hypothetical protein